MNTNNPAPETDKERLLSLIVDFKFPNKDGFNDIVIATKATEIMLSFMAWKTHALEDISKL